MDRFVVAEVEGRPGAKEEKAEEGEVNKEVTNPLKLLKARPNPKPGEMKCLFALLPAEVDLYSYSE